MNVNTSQPEVAASCRAENTCDKSVPIMTGDFS